VIKFLRWEKLNRLCKACNTFIATFACFWEKYVMDAEKKAAEVARLLNVDFAIRCIMGRCSGTIEDAQKFVNYCEDKAIKS